MIDKEIAVYMSEGHWFISMYNDFGESQEVEFLAELSLEMTEGCPRGCSGHGECVLGKCQCDTGFAGDDCSQGNLHTHLIFVSLSIQILVLYLHEL